MRRLILSVFFIGVFIASAYSQIPGLKGRSGYFTMPATIKEGDYISNKVIFKLKKEYSSLANNTSISHSDFQALLVAINGSLNKKHLSSFKSVHGVVGRFNEDAPLARIYELDYKDAYPVELVINQLYSFNLVEYAEPIYIPKLLYTPNDPQATNQYYLTLISAYPAWDVQKGDTNIVIGIVDTGVELTHPDLINNIKHNYNDPIDGLDNDGDGYIDNYSGWDLGEGDNDPTPSAGGQHGTWVSGCAVAVPDNGGGGVGVGFNTKIMPIKITNSSGYLTAAYDGIVYAAEHGCKVINNSWGTEGGYSQYCQEIVNYAVAKGCVVVAAAGNNNNEGLFYPASYENVVSVAGTDQTDQKWIFNTPNGSNYNGFVDLCAPAKAIYTTYQGGGFINIGGGTSFASPQVAAAAALVMAQFPSYTNKQVVGQLKVTTSNIYSLPFNTTYAGKLGTGRLNVFKALTETSYSYVEPAAVRTVYGRLGAGETVDIWIDLINQLAATSGVTATISTSNPNVTIVSNSSSYGSIGTKEKKAGSAPFEITVGTGASINELVVFEVLATNGAYEWKENISIRVNRDYVDVSANDLYTSVTNYGAVGYDFAMFGQGVKYKNTTSLMYEMGLMIGTDSSHVSASRDFEFYTDPLMTIAAPGESDFDVSGTFNDISAGGNSLSTEVTQKTMAWSSAGHNKYVIVEYCIKNKGTTDITNGYVGLYADFDIIDGKKNKAGYVAGKRLGYGYKEGGVYAGIQLLTNDQANFYAFNNDGSNGSINLSDGFSSSEQFMALSAATSHTSATEGDIAGMLSAGPLNIPQGDSTWVTFAIIGGDNLNDLIASANNAASKYKDMRAVKMTLADFADVSCKGATNGKIAVDLSSGKQPYAISWTNAPGVTTATADNLSAGTYTVKVKDKMKFEATQTFTISEPTALKISMGAVKDVDCNGDYSGSVQVNVSGGTPTYYYNWHNSSISSVANPALPAGKHIVTVSDARGCSLSDSIKVSEPVKLIAAVASHTDDTTNTSQGSATITVSGGTGSYTYAWDDALSQHTSTATGLSAKNYTVTISDSHNCQVTQEVTIAGGSNKNAIEENDPSRYSMTVFPNPANNYFFVEFELPEHESLDLSIYDENGKKVKEVISGVYTKGAYKVLVSSEDLNSGLYFYQLKTSSASATGKVTVLK
ncbi:MAG: S8 family serine peptidase [Flavobacteriales bacterium]